MKNIKQDFLKKVSLIVKDEDKIEKIKPLTESLILKCVNSFKLKEAVVILDKNLNIIDTDNHFEEWFKLKKDDLKGKNIYDFFSKELENTIEVFFKKVHKNKSFRKSNLIIHIDDIEEKVDLEGKIFLFKGEECIFLSIKKRLIDTPLYKLKTIEEEIGNLVLRVKDFKTLMKEVLKIFINSHLFDDGWVAKVDKDLKKVIPVVKLKNGKDFENKIFDFDYFEGIFDILMNKEEVIIDNVELEGHRYKKAVIFPIFNKWEYGKEDEIEYAILLYSEENLHFKDEEVILLKEIIYKLNIAIADIFIKQQTSILISTDVLTNLPNREIFIKQIEQFINEKVPFAVAIIDINRLKKVNSVFGFWAGDKAIKNLANFLKKNLKSDLIYRIGGDEFGVIIRGSKSKIFEKLNKILSFNDDITQLNGSGVYLSISVGVSFFPEDSKTTEELIFKAEKAVEAVKNRGTKGIAYANKDWGILPNDYLLLERELKEAIKNDEYVMYYQPIIDVKNNKVWSAEALLRWNSKKRGLVSPAKFIPILEESGLINEVGDVIIKKVLNDIKDFESEDISFIVSINISGVQLLTQNIASKLINSVKKMGVSSNKIIVEITETVLMKNIEAILPQMDLLKKEGIQIEIDDFGTGYSSLAYLKKLPVNSLKIDREFVKDILVDNGDAQIVKAIISMAKALNKKTIAEGAETKEVVDELKRLGVDYIQGFYFAKPMRKEDLKKFLASF